MKTFACGAHFQFHKHDLLKKVIGIKSPSKNLIGIKSLSAKQCPKELSP